MPARLAAEGSILSATQAPGSPAPSAPRRDGFQEALASLATRPGRFVPGVVLLAVALRLGAGLFFPGFQTGDDVEIVESALAAIGAIDYQPWALRNQLLPRHLLGPLLAAGTAVGIVEPQAQVVLARVIFALFGGLTVWLTWRLGLRLFERREVAALGALLIGFHPLALAFGATTLPRGASTAAVVGAALLALGPRERAASASRLALAGVLLAAAFACRYSEAIFLAPLLMVAAAADPRRRLVAAGSLVAGFAAGVIVLVGIEDWLTFGAPFASLREFAQYTLIERQASARVAVQPAEWYLRRLLFWIPASLLPAFFFVDRSKVGARQLALMVGLPVLLLSLVHHKDLRYLNGVLPFVALLGAAGLVGLSLRGGAQRRVAGALIAVTLALGLYRAGRILVDGSNASVAAARLLAATPELQAVGATQLWAFGDKIYLGRKTRLVELGVRPTASSLRPLIGDLDAVALHALSAGPELGPLLRELGFQEWTTVSGWGDDAVTILRR